MNNILLSPPITMGVFLLLAFGLYRLGGAVAAQGDAHPDKHLPYTGGEDMVPPTRQLSYQAFFHLALMFALLHISVLVLSTLSRNPSSHRLALFYLLGVGLSVFVLTEGEL